MFLRNIKNLQELLRYERSLYFSTLKEYINARIRNSRDYQTWTFQSSYRKAEYFFNKKKESVFALLAYLFYENKRNKIGQRIGIDIGFNCFDKGLVFYHNNVIGGSSKVGKNCRFHGQNCIGSMAYVGNNCEFMVGAKVFYPAKLGDNVIVAAGSIVLGGCNELDNVLIGGVPARVLKRLN